MGPRAHNFREDPVIRSVGISQVDVFTRDRFAGNPAGVVLNADGMTDREMMAIAREMNLSETAFVFRPGADGAVPVRFFTPLREVPVCGHATLAAHFIRCGAEGLGEAGAASQVSPGARWDIRWESRDGATLFVMRQGPVEYGEVLDDPLRHTVMDVLGIGEGDLLSDAPVQVVSTGHAKVIVPIVSPEVLLGVAPDMARLRSVSEETGVSGFFLFSTEASHRDTDTVCRMFAPAVGIDEDPVNGSGHGPLAAYLLQRGGAGADLARRGFWSRMGEHLGRAGRVWVQAMQDGESVEVGGYVTPVFSTVIEIDRPDQPPVTSTKQLQRSDS